MGVRGGWSWTLQTENKMSDPRSQPSLSESLRLGAGKARRQEVLGGPELRNFRRSTPMGKQHIK